MATWFDHLFAVAVAVGLPIEGSIAFRRLLAAVRTDRPDARLPTYRNTILVQWFLVAGLAAWWVAQGRPLPALGLGPIGTAAAVIGALPLLPLIALARVQQRSLAALPPDRLRGVREQIGDLARMLPRSRREVRWFRATSLTAGICEELLYRGFALWYLTPPLGTAGAMAASSLAFGLAHAYQGPKGIVKTTVIGALLAVLYVATDALWAPMVLHAGIDLVAGALGPRLWADGRPEVTA